MDDLIVFLRARLGEDEAVARDAADPMEEVPGSWRYDEDARPVPRIVGASWESSLTDGVWNCDDPDDHCEELRHPSRCAGRHIARFDPARALREVEARRRRLALYLDAREVLAAVLEAAPALDDPAVAHSHVRERVNVNQASGRFAAFEMSVRLDAVIWCDHPDYRPEWKP